MWLRYWNVDWLPWGNVHQRACLAHYFYHLKHTVFWIYILLITPRSCVRAPIPEVVGYWNIFAVARLCDNHVTHLTWGNVDTRTGHTCCYNRLNSTSDCMYVLLTVYTSIFRAPVEDVPVVYIYILYVQSSMSIWSGALPLYPTCLSSLPPYKPFMYCRMLWQRPRT